MVDPLLKGAIHVRECFGAAAKLHILAEVVTAFLTPRATIAHDTGFDRDSLTWHKIRHGRSNRGDNAGCLMTKNKGCLHSEIAILAMQEVMYCGDILSVDAKARHWSRTYGRFHRDRWQPRRLVLD